MSSVVAPNSIACAACGDHRAGDAGDHPYAEHAVGLRIGDDLDEAVGLAVGLGAAVGEHRKFANLHHDVIPSVVYTMPEIAGVGLTEEQAKEHGEVKVGKFPMLANSRAKTNREPDGFVKVIADAKTDRVLGVWMIAIGRRHDDRPGRAGDGVRRDERGHRLHLPRPPDAQRSAQGSGDGGDREADPHLS